MNTTKLMKTWKQWLKTFHQQYVPIWNKSMTLDLKQQEMLKLESKMPSIQSQRRTEKIDLYNELISSALKTCINWTWKIEIYYFPLKNCLCYVFFCMSMLAKKLFTKQQTSWRLASICMQIDKCLIVAELFFFHLILHVSIFNQKVNRLLSAQWYYTRWMCTEQETAS